MTKLDLEKLKRNFQCEVLKVVGPTPPNMELYMLVNGTIKERIKTPLGFASEYNMPFGKDQ